MIQKCVAVVANNGDIGGGEVMLFRIAERLRSFNFDVTVVAPTTPDEVLWAAASKGFRTKPIDASCRASYMTRLFHWRLRNRHVPMWCNGLVPSLATSGMRRRVVHLHSTPQGKHKVAAHIARLRADATLVPSAFAATYVPGAQLFPNWTESIGGKRYSATSESLTRIGYLGRLTVRKGVVDLARAVGRLRDEGEDMALVVGGELKHAAPEDAQQIHNAFSSLGSAVKILGWVEPEAFFRDIDLLVVPSRLPETFGLVVAEAMAYGIPTLVSDAGALVEVAGEEYPWVFRAGEVDDLTRMLRQVVTEWPEKASELAIHGKQRWNTLYSPDAGEQRLTALLSSISQQSFGRAN